MYFTTDDRIPRKVVTLAVSSLGDVEICLNGQAVAWFYGEVNEFRILDGILKDKGIRTIFTGK